MEQQIARLGEIDTINERFSCEATLFITWIENTQLFEKSTENDNSGGTYEWDTSKLWDPQLVRLLNLFLK